jgi:hypothetical protein
MALMALITAIPNTAPQTRATRRRRRERLASMRCGATETHHYL